MWKIKTCIWGENEPCSRRDSDSPVPNLVDPSPTVINPRLFPELAYFIDKFSAWISVYDLSEKEN